MQVPVREFAEASPSAWSRRVNFLPGVPQAGGKKLQEVNWKFEFRFLGKAGYRWGQLVKFDLMPRWC